MMDCRIAMGIIAATLSLVVGHGSLAAEIASPLEPAAAQQAFVLADANLRIELAAAEPEVIDPVAVRFDEDGRMWVAEMRDYPFGPPKAQAPLSRIRILEDADGDGRFEKSTTFADKLSFVTGLQPWKGGAFVTLSGAVAYMKDTDGDGQCDSDETWFEGFAEENTQLRANHPRLGIDNWIYVSNGLRGGKVTSRKLADQRVIDISGMDFRFDPLTGKAEAVSGNGQFGLTFDDWGNRFTCTNRNPCRHAVIEDRYLKANPGVTVPAVMHDVAAAAEASRIFPLSRAWTTSNLHAGQFTAACGVHIYRGDLLPPEFYGNVFTCDPTGNLIHREIMRPAGPTFTSKPAYEGQEFLASPDEWFRPVNMELGPDGALYVVDMYRCVIEHPDFVPDELKNRPDQRLGDDRGRIWRIVPTDTSPQREQGLSRLPLSPANTDDLLPLLGHANAWHRETAQRLLLQLADQAPTPKLRELAASAAEPQTRARALWLLAGLSSLEANDVAARLEDSDPQVCRQAMMLAERFGDVESLQNQLTRMTGHENATLRFQARLSAKSPGIAQFEPLGDLADPWMTAAIKLRLTPELASAALKRLFDPRQPQVGQLPPQFAFVEELSELATAAKAVSVRDLAIHAIIANVTQPSEPVAGLAALRGVLRGLGRRGIALSDVKLPDHPWPQVTERVSQLAESAETSPQVRLHAIDVLGYLPDSITTLKPLAAREEEQPVRIAAISALSRQPGVEVWQELLASFPAETPPVRRAILDGLLSNPERTKLLLDALEAGTIKPSELDASYVTRLNNSGDAAIKARAGKLFAAATPAERAKALADYQPVLALPADAKRGQAIFEKNCAVCHKVGGVGVNVAPDISDTRTKKLDQLLGDILLPNRAIDNNYLGYSVRLLDGTVATGILSAETTTSITLRQQGGKEAVIPRSEIEELKSSGVSLMPEGLERQIPHQEMADLLSFLKNWRYLDGRTPLGK